MTGSGAEHQAMRLPGRERECAAIDRVLDGDLVAGTPIRLDSRGVHELKGVPGSWEVFAVVN